MIVGGNKMKKSILSINLRLNKIINPTSIDNKSIKKIRENLNDESTKWPKKPISFSYCSERYIRHTQLDL